MLRFLSLAFVLVVLCSARAAEARKNIVLFVNDDLSTELGCYGNKVIRTPNIDRLAADGVRFDYAFCTTASCSASRSVLLTGLHNHANGQYGLAHAEHHFVGFGKHPTLPVLLAEAGYRTALVGKLHVEPVAAYRFGETIKANSRNAVQMAEACREFIAAKSEQPFFLYFCPTDPHRSLGAGKVGQTDPFGNVPVGHAGVKEEKYSPDEVIVPPYLPDTPACRAELAEYYQSASRIDQGLGRLREILKEAGVEDETLIVFTSDNGIAFPGAKTTLYEPGMRIPLIVYAPGVENEEHQCDAMVSHVDMTPTLLDWAGARGGPGTGKEKTGLRFHGRSWLGELGTAQPEKWDEIEASHTFHEVTMYYPMRVVRGRKYKLIWNVAHELEYPFASDLWGSATWQDALKRGDEFLYGKRTVKAFLHRAEFELYDLGTDPHETRNLALLPEMESVLSQMVEKLKAFQKRTNDPWSIKWEHE
jgi:N-sulfoglucosamine sulfohydrolase